MDEFTMNMEALGSVEANGHDSMPPEYSLSPKRKVRRAVAQDSARSLRCLPGLLEQGKDTSDNDNCKMETSPSSLRKPPMHRKHSSRRSTMSIIDPPDEIVFENKKDDSSSGSDEPPNEIANIEIIIDNSKKIRRRASIVDDTDDLPVSRLEEEIKLHQGLVSLSGYSDDKDGQDVGRRTAWREMALSKRGDHPRRKSLSRASLLTRSVSSLILDAASSRGSTGKLESVSSLNPRNDDDMRSLTGESIAALSMDRRGARLKREVLIDSLAWFSFHAPRCVLEDITTFELKQLQLELTRSQEDSSSDEPSADEGASHEATSTVSSLSANEMNGTGDADTANKMRKESKGSDTSKDEAAKGVVEDGAGMATQTPAEKDMLAPSETEKLPLETSGSRRSVHTKDAGADAEKTQLEPSGSQRSVNTKDATPSRRGGRQLPGSTNVTDALPELPLDTEQPSIADESNTRDIVEPSPLPAGRIQRTRSALPLFTEQPSIADESNTRVVEPLPLPPGRMQRRSSVRFMPQTEPVIKEETEQEINGSDHAPPPDPPVICNVTGPASPAASPQEVQHIKGEARNGQSSPESQISASGLHSERMLTLPYATKRNSALLFVDITGFTRLSTLLDEESLSKVINSYFEMIVNEVLSHGGDILKFAGDAFFAEWQATAPGEDDSYSLQKKKSLFRFDSRGSCSRNQQYSFKHLSPFDWNGRSLSECAVAAAFCGAAIVEKYSDFEVPTKDRAIAAALGPGGAVLNVHCGLGAGSLVGLHVGGSVNTGDHEYMEHRREYLFLGSPIDQVSEAGEIASDGEIVASREAIDLLSESCRIPDRILQAKGPSVIAARENVFVAPRAHRHLNVSSLTLGTTGTKLSVYESLRLHCGEMDDSTLARLRHQLALYVHPVVRGEEYAKSSSDYGSCADHLKSRHLAQRRQRAEAELRWVYTMFINAVLPATVTGNEEQDLELFQMLSSVMQTTCRELDRFSGHLRQFIVDDKGVVLIATFGLRGSTFPNMVANNALPATFAIHTALKKELNVDNRIGASFGKVYCGVVGGVRRHEFAVMGAPVNLAARLMCNAKNGGILVDEAVQLQAGSKFVFKSLPAVNAKGYSKPVPILEPLQPIIIKKRGGTTVFVGRQTEKSNFLQVAREMIDEPLPSRPQMVFLSGESGIGKSALINCACDEIKKYCSLGQKACVVVRTISNETELLVPLSTFRKIFLNVVKELCLNDGTALNYNPSDEPTDFQRRGSVRRMRSQKLMRMSFRRAGSFRRGGSRRGGMVRFDSLASLASARSVVVPYLQKLCWVCEELQYPYEFADIVGSRLLGLEDANRNVSTVDGRSPTLDEMVEFMTLAFIRLTEYADFCVVILDDWQWVDALSWKVMKSLWERGENLMIVSAMRSHDKQAARRMSLVRSIGPSDLGRITEIELGPMEISEMKELMASILGYDTAAIEEDLCNDIYEKTCGLPVFAIELLENIKRNNMLVMNKTGQLGWSSSTDGDQLRSGTNGVAVIEELFLNRFDSLDFTVRKLLQTCAVLGMEFALTDVLRVHPEVGEIEIEKSLDTAVAEFILVEDLDEDWDDEEEVSTSSSQGPNRTDDSRVSAASWNAYEERVFQFSHGMWRNSVLKTMLKERRIELHRAIAESMQKDRRYFVMENSDTATLLTLFDHWKLCGEFTKAAPIALAVGNRLEDWDYARQSLELYKDALQMCRPETEEEGDDENRKENEINNLSSAPQATLDLILRLQIRIGRCLSRLGDQIQSISVFREAHAVLMKSPFAKTMSRALILPILSGLCLVSSQGGVLDESKLTEEKELVGRFVAEARQDGNPIHMCRALAMEGTLYARVGDYQRALEAQNDLEHIYRIEVHSRGIREEYGKDFAAQMYSDSVQWHCLVKNTERALNQIEFVVKHHIPMLQERDIDNTMSIAFPVLLVMKEMGMAARAGEVLKTYVINPFHKFGASSAFWLPLYNPTAYLLDIIRMDQDHSCDQQMLADIESWVLRDESSKFPTAMECNGYMLNGEICWRLAKKKPAADPSRQELAEKGKLLFSYALRYKQDKKDAFMMRNAEKMLTNLERLSSPPKPPKEAPLEAAKPPVPVQTVESGCQCIIL